MLEFYISIIIFGVFYGIIREVFEFDLPIGQSLLAGIPTGFISWGIIGIASDGNEPLSFITGFILISVFVSTLISMIVVSVDESKEYIGFTGKVDIPIKPDGFGKIVVKTERGNSYFNAKSYHSLSKPVIRGSWIKIVKFEGVIAYVIEVKEDEGKSPNILKKPKSKPKRFWIPIIEKMNFLNRNKNTCGICYSIIKASVTDVKCENCAVSFHNDHILSWLDIQNECPNCRKPVELKGSKLQLVVKGDK